MSVEPAPVGASPPRARFLGALFAGLLGFYGFFAHGYLENTDTDVTMHAARALYLRGDPGLRADGDGTWAAERHIAQSGLFGIRGENGRQYIWFPIGHQLLMLPCVALGDLFGRWFPEVEQDYERRLGPVFGAFYWTRFFISFLPVLCAAGSTLMILFVCRFLGCGMREALSVTAISTLCTQFWPAASETLSDGPGGFFLLAIAALVFAGWTGRTGALAARSRSTQTADYPGFCPKTLEHSHPSSYPGLSPSATFGHLEGSLIAQSRRDWNHGRPPVLQGNRRVRCSP